MSKLIGIYQITSPSEKVYVGQSWDIRTRWGGYRNPVRSREQRHLYNSFNKYGVDSHRFELVCQLLPNGNQSDLDDLEVRYIEELKTRGVPLLNIKNGGRGGKHSDETRQIISARHKGRKHTPKHVEHQRLTLIGRTFSPETLAKMSAAKKGKQFRLGIRHTQESIEKMRRNQRRKLTEDQTNEIRRRYQKGVQGCGYRRLGEEFGVTFSMIRHIIKRTRFAE